MAFALNLGTLMLKAGSLQEQPTVFHLSQETICVCTFVLTYCSPLKVFHKVLNLGN